MTDDRTIDVIQTVREIWRDILSLDDAEVDDEDNFFDLGGHSMLAVAFVAQTEAATGVSIPLEDIFEDGRLGHILATLRALSHR
jgi:acyl carrier protein